MRARGSVARTRGRPDGRVGIPARRSRLNRYLLARPQHAAAVHGCALRGGLQAREIGPIGTADRRSVEEKLSGRLENFTTFIFLIAVGKGDDNDNNDD